MSKIKISAVLIGIGLIAGGLVYSQRANQSERDSRPLLRVGRSLADLHQPLGKPGPGDWLANHKEPGQTMRQYLRARPVRMTERRNKLYIQPIGDFSIAQRQIVELSAEFMSLYFDCETKIQETISMDAIPDSAKRVHPSWGDHQILTTYVLDRVLKPDLPNDAVARIAFTATDLWPGENWNFVFGQASLQGRVGVWSIYRHGDPSKSKPEFRKCLERAVKVATHETGHMFSMLHCIYHECNMCGSNSLQESDRQPLYLCDVCLPKLLWATHAKPAERFERLFQFCKKHELTNAATYYDKARQRFQK